MINQQMKMALDKIAFLPFGKLIDQWRWKVFSGEIKPENYNKAWWELREQYQGVAPPVARTEEDFDPGAKYHIPGEHAVHALLPVLHPAVPVPQGAVRRGRASRARCTSARCSAARRRARSSAQMLALGASQPWPDTLEKLTGTREIDASPIIDYFRPLSAG